VPIPVPITLFAMTSAASSEGCFRVIMTGIPIKIAASVECGPSDCLFVGMVRYIVLLFPVEKCL
jgi:hypothetical protein